MNRSYDPINDELLSAYIDGDVTEEERKQIETAIAIDPEIAWQVETLRQTVALLQELPPIPLPKSFVLREEQVADVLTERRHSAPVSASAVMATPGLWRHTLSFFNSGNLALRNASAIAAILFIILLVGEPYLQPSYLQSPATAPAMEAMRAEVASEPSVEEMADPSLATFRAMEAQGEALPAPDAVPVPEAPETSIREPLATAADQDLRTLPGESAQRSALPEDEPAPEAATLQMESMALPAEVEDAESTDERGVVETSIAETPVEMDAPASVLGEESASDAVLDEPQEKAVVVPMEDAPLAESPSLAQVATAPAEAVALEQTVEGATWGVWRIMQVGTLLLALLLVLLWLGSRQRAAGR